MKNFYSKYLIIFFLILSLCGCINKSPLGSRKNPIKLYFTPSIDSGVIIKNSEKFIAYLEKKTGVFFKTGIPTNYISVVEALGSNRADIAVINSFGYLLAHQKYGAQAKLKVIRHGLDYYQGQIITHVDSGFNSIKDLDQKKFAFTDSSSSSGYLFPLKILKDNQVTPSNIVFALKHDNVITMVYQKQVDAGAVFYGPPAEDGSLRDARKLVLTQFPDVADKIKIIQITDKIPNDPFVFRKDFPVDLATTIIKYIKEFISTKEGRIVFQNIYSVSGVVDANDHDYDGLRDVIKTINVDVKKLFK